MDLPIVYISSQLDQNVYGVKRFVNPPIMSAANIYDLKDNIENESYPSYWGAVGDGIADDTHAVNQCFHNNTRVVVLNAKYKVNAQIVCVGKPDLSVFCDGATLLGNVTGNIIRFSDCLNIRVFGSLTIKTLLSNNTTVGCFISKCHNGNFSGICVDGQYALNGVTNLKTGIELAINGGTPAPGTFSATLISKCTVSGCANGIDIQGEYYTVNDCLVNYNNYGVHIVNGNSSVIGSQFVANRIALFVNSYNANNTDHSRCVGCTMNHNLVGIYVRRTVYSWLISSCDIWANIVDPFALGWNGTFSEAIATYARTKQFGIYLEDVENINIVGNMIARNTINVGYSGIVMTSISNNSFLSDSGRTLYHIFEVGTAQSTYNANAQVTICSNTFDGPLVGNSNNALTFSGGSNSMRYNIRYSYYNNVGIVGDDYVTCDQSNQVYTLDCTKKVFRIDAAQTSNFYFWHSSLCGNDFYVFIYNHSGSATNVIIERPYSSGNIPTIINGTGLSYNSTNSAYTFSANGYWFFKARGSLPDQNDIIKLF